MVVNNATAGPAVWAARGSVILGIMMAVPIRVGRPDHARQHLGARATTAAPDADRGPYRTTREPENPTPPMLRTTVPRSQPWVGQPNNSARPTRAAPVKISAGAAQETDRCRQRCRCRDGGSPGNRVS